MAGDATIQSALQTVIQGLTSTFATADVVLGDLKVIGRGSAPYAIVLPGPMRSERSGDWGQVRYRWTHYVEVWDRFTGDSYSAIVTAVQSVVDEINAHPSLDGTAGIVNCLVEARSELMYLWQKGQARTTLPSFVGFRLTVGTIEEVVYAADEFVT